MRNGLIDNIVNLEEEEALNRVEELLAEDKSVMDIMGDCRKAMKKVGDKFERKEYFIPQLIMAAEIMNQITEMTEEKFDKNQKGSKLGKIVIGTVEGDIHDIGKSVVDFNLDVNGFEVIDIGEDISSDKFIQEIQKHNPDIVGLSCLLTVAFDSMKEIIDDVQKANLREGIKIIIGGAPIDDEICEYVGADGWAEDAVKAVDLAKNMIEGC